MLPILPPELLENILDYLPLHDLYFLCRASTFLYAFFSENEPFWKKQYKRRHGEYLGIGSYKESYILLITRRKVDITYFGMSPRNPGKSETVLTRQATIFELGKITGRWGPMYAVGTRYLYRLQENKDWSAAYDDGARKILACAYNKPDSYAIVGVGIISIAGHYETIYLDLLSREENITRLYQRILERCDLTGFLRHITRFSVILHEMQSNAAVERNDDKYDLKIISPPTQLLAKNYQGMLQILHIDIARC